MSGLGTPGRPFRLGAIADPKEPLGDTLGNLRRFAAVFRSEHVHAVIALGGLGGTEEEIISALLALKGADAPIFALPGDREPEGFFHTAVARAKNAGLPVTDLSVVRAVRGDAASLVSLPGYAFPRALAAGGSACRYTAADVEAVRGLVEGLGAQAADLVVPPIVFVAHSPPRGDGPEALDWALGHANVGDPRLTRLIDDAGLKWGLFAHVGEAGGRGSDGRRPVPPETFSERLFVNVGTADSVPHPVANGVGRGQAAILELDSGRGRFKVVR
jgi:hypothetical protein